MNVPHTTHLVWTGKSWVQGSFWDLPHSTVFFFFFFTYVELQRHCASVLQAGTRVHNTHNWALFSSLSNSVSRHKRNMLLLRSVTCYSLPVASACNVTNQNYILTLNIPRGILWGPQRVIFCDPAVTISNNLLLILVCVPHQLKINIM